MIIYEDDLIAICNSPCDFTCDAKVALSVNYYSLLSTEGHTVEIRIFPVDGEFFNPVTNVIHGSLAHLGQKLNKDTKFELAVNHDEKQRFTNSSMIIFGKKETMFQLCNRRDDKYIDIRGIYEGQICSSNLFLEWLRKGITLKQGSAQMSDLGPASGPASVEPSMNIPWVVRAFEDCQSRWDAIKRTISAPVSPFGFIANVKFVDEAKFYGLSDPELILALPKCYPFDFVFVAPGDSSRDGEDILTLLWFRSGRAVVADEIGASVKDLEKNLLKVRHSARLVRELENNLSIANIDSDDIFECISEDGFFHGFKS